MVHMLSAARKAVVVFAALALSSSTTYALPQQSSCAKTHPLVGTTIAFASESAIFQVNGSFNIVDDCTAIVPTFVTNGPSPFSLIGVSRQTNFPVNLFVSDSLGVSRAQQRLVLRQGTTWDSADAVLVLSAGKVIGSAVFPQIAPSPIPSPTPPAPPAPVVVTTTTAPAPIVVTPSPTPPVSTERFIAKALTIVVTVGPNPNYPLKPTQLNVSFYLNYVETPQLNLTRGVTYTFIVIGGNTHPFYLTTSQEGAKGNNAASNETIFAGNSKSFGNGTNPFQLVFTPDATHPDTLYYQCWNHRRMGWVVNLQNGNTVLPSNDTTDSITPVGPPPQVIAGSGAVALSASGAVAVILVVLVSVFLF